MSFAPLSMSIRPDEKLVTVVAPHSFFLCLDDGRRMAIPAGTFEAPEIVADHPYSAAHGLHRYAPTVVATTAAPVSAPLAEPNSVVATKRSPGRPRKTDAATPTTDAADGEGGGDADGDE